ncbi:hypothetical protein ACFQ3S_08355 [Mucilaginibacter terrae]|uniref:hypothetical protein n=1 Tax=Mucilaginibacter terrae TaxID=1955052 RepID=UPI0036293886
MKFFVLLSIMSCLCSCSLFGQNTRAKTPNKQRSAPVKPRTIVVNDTTSLTNILPTDSLIIQPRDVHKYIGRLAHVAAYASFKEELKDTVIMHIYSPVGNKKEIMTMVLTGSAAKPFRGANKNELVGKGRVNIRNGLPNLNISNIKDIEFWMSVD